METRTFGSIRQLPFYLDGLYPGNRKAALSYQSLNLLRSKGDCSHSFSSRVSLKDKYLCASLKCGVNFGGHILLGGSLSKFLISTVALSSITSNPGRVIQGGTELGFPNGPRT